jgi:hypothetical protein
MELNIGHPGALADLASVNTAVILMPFLTACCLNSLIWESIDKVWRSSAGFAAIHKICGHGFRKYQKCIK